jgi:outer membrane protein assembly factor BamB
VRRFLTSLAIAAAVAGAALTSFGAAATPARRRPAARGASASPACPPTFARWPAGAAPEPALVDPRAGAELAPAWEHRARPGTLLRFDGVVDPAGNVYWIEARPDGRTGELVSATRGGDVRFRAPMSGSSLVLAGDIVVANLAGSGCRGLAAPALEAHRTRDGAPAWRREILPAIEVWMRTPGTCRYGGARAVALSGGHVVVAASILDANTKEHESGFVALDAATGGVAWEARTSAEGNVSQSGTPRVAEDGRVYASRRATAQREPLLVLAGGAPRELGAASAASLHRDVLAAAGGLLFSEGATGSDPTVGSPATVEVRCRATGELLGAVDAPGAVPLAAGGAVWLFGDKLSRHDAATGELQWRVTLGEATAAPTARGRTAIILRTEPVVTRGGAILFAEQPELLRTAIATLEPGAPVLREIDAAGRETLRRTLPGGAEAYSGAAALDRGRWFVAALPYHAAQGGVIRAFDVAGRSVAQHGWVTPKGSLARDAQAR